MMKSRLFALGLPLGIAAVGAAVWLAASPGKTEPNHAPGSDHSALSSSPKSVAFIEALERYRSDRPEDWVGHADYVVVARVTSEHELPPAKSETVTGGGSQLVGRRIDIEILDSVWSNPLSQVSELPDAATISAAGWFTDEKTGRSEAVTEQSSRLEVGHTYVLGLFEVNQKCASDGQAGGANWSVFGSMGAIPYDDEVFGVGELQGVESNEPFANADTVPGSLFAAVKGKSLSDLTKLLSSTKQREEPSEASSAVGTSCDS
jgi:hypothetical protein